MTRPPRQPNASALATKRPTAARVTQTAPATRLVPGVARLQVHECATAAYSLIDSEPTAYHAPFVGCISGKEDCCPFIPKATANAGTLAGEYSPFQTASGARNPQENRGKGVCAGDYTLISGQCCPSGYIPWTTLLGDQTPCFSSMTATMTPPPISSNTAAPASKSTMAITGALFAVTFPPTQSDDSGGLSTGAIAGIVVGVAAGILAMIALSILLCRRRKQSKHLKSLKSELRNSYFARDEGRSEVPTTPMSMQGNDGQLGLHRREVSLGAMSMGVGRGGGVPRRCPSAALKDQPHSSSQFSSPEVGELAIAPAAEERDDTFSPPSSGSSHPQELHGIHEVQLARPQRLSRGYARIVHTTNSTGSNGSVHGEPSESRLAELP
ncbi:hypothetical protein B0T14DRAFT_142386 [Immersiella caudata]|uniref:Uncharacterized protein n=1 Tax=Immersiella caudata TaxID=314043 RepID=A0AA39X5W2_9PEZI|nr:hypothetical protein B0T14DRAFT_142386 [Immersiella caudata]